MSDEHEERQYLSLVQRVIGTGEHRNDRTGTGTVALFAPPALRFTLGTSGQLPLLTTKRTFLKAIVEELLWFVRGDTDARHLAQRGVHIWDGNASRAFLDARGLAYEEGDLGPVYGFQWRHFGARYAGCGKDYTGQGVDQLKECIDKIRHQPTDRRIVLSAWNPAAIPEMALPPCHMMCQFYVHMAPPGGKNGLSCLMYQRSADLGLGIPFNIASYAILTHMIAHVTNTEPRELIIQLGDAHVYKDHVEPLKTQLKRTPRPFPTIRFAREIDDIDKFEYEDIIVEGYNPHPTIPMKMSV